MHAADTSPGSRRRGCRRSARAPGLLRSYAAVFTGRLTRDLPFVKAGCWRLVAVKRRRSVKERPGLPVTGRHALLRRVKLTGARAAPYDLRRQSQRTVGLRGSSPSGARASVSAGRYMGIQKSMHPSAATLFTAGGVASQFAWRVLPTPKPAATFGAINRVLSPLRA